MGRFLRTIALLTLAAALLNATEGLCFCCPDATHAASGSGSEHACCHRAVVSISAGHACCQIDRAEHRATAQAAASAPPVDATASQPVLARIDAVAPHTANPVAVLDTSPPTLALRI